MKPSKPGIAFTGVQLLLLQRWFEQAPGFVALLSGPTHVVEMANPAYLRLVNGDAGLIGQPVFEALPGLRGQGFEELLAGAFRSGESFVGRDMAIKVQLKPDGAMSESFVDFVHQPILRDDGSVYGVFVEGVDVTERHEAIEFLKLADRRKDTALAVLAHELKGPFQSLTRALENLREKALIGSDSACDLDIAVRSVHSLDRLISDLADLVNIRSGRIAIERHPVSIEAVIDRAAEICTPAMDRRKQVFFVDVPAEPVTIDADIGRMTQVVVNLLDNASKYTPPHGVVTLSVDTEPGRATIRVTDSGIGIAPDLLDRIFDLSALASGNAPPVEGKLGIGLTLVRRLVVLHDGTVTATSAGLGQGSEFRVSLPLAK